MHLPKFVLATALFPAFRIRCLVLVVQSALIALLVAGCSNDSAPAPSSPTAAGPTAAPAAPAGVNVQNVSYRDRRMVIDWPASSGATSYKVLVGNAPGDSRFGAFTTDTTTYELRDLPISNRTSPDTQLVGVDLSSYVCIQAVNAVGTSSCASRPLVMPDARDVIDALFFSRGQYRDRSDRVPERSSWWGFREGSAVTIRMSSSVSADQRSAIRRLIDHTNQVLPGLYQVAIEEPEISLDNAVLSRQFVAGQIVVASFATDVVLSSCGGTTTQACAPLSSAGLYAGSQMVLGHTNSSRTVQHELGHALLGLGHVFMSPPPVDSFPWWEHLVMGMLPISTLGRFADAYSSFEAELLKAVYESGLRPGDSRDAFLSRGLVR